MHGNDFLAALNESLLELETILERETEEHYANIFVLGLPRSATTLLSQTIFNNMRVMCTNNLVARFPKVPIIGCLLSKIAIGEVKGFNYRSNYGQTTKPWEPHEFSWFWHDVLNIHGDDLSSGMDAEREINWDRLRSKLINMNSIFACAMVHKPLELAGYNLKGFVESFDKIVFIFIERDPIDIAYSLALARKDRCGDLNSWWSSYPTKAQYSLLKDRKYSVQIAGQVTFLSKMYTENLGLVPEDRLIRTSYDTLCNNPIELLEEIRKRTIHLGCEVDITATPKKFKPVKREKDAALVADLSKGFKIVRSWIDV